MKNMKKIIIFCSAFLLIAIFLYMAVNLLRNECVPNQKIKDLSFYSLSKDTQNDLIERMAIFKKEHRNLVQQNLHQDMMWQFLPPEGYLEMMENEKKVVVNGERLNISKNKMRWLSNNLISPSVWDEQNILRTLYRFQPKNFDFNPHYFRYGGSWLYPMSFGLYVSSKIGAFKLVKDTAYYMRNPNDILSLSIVAKSYGILCWIMTIFALYLIASRFYNLRIFMFLVFFMVFCPALIVETVYLKPFLTSMMWNGFGAYFIFRILEDKGKKGRNAVCAGLFIGLAAGSLITSASMLLPLFIALTYKRLFSQAQCIRKFFSPPYADLKHIVYSVLLFLAAFFMTNPYTLLSWQEFAKEMSFNIGYRSNYHFWDIKMHMQNMAIMYKGLSLPFGLLSISSIIWAIFNNWNKKIRIILFALLAYYLCVFVECFIEGNIHALVPVLPFLILLSAQFIDYLLSKRNIIRYGTYCLVVCIALYSLLNSLFYVHMLREQPRITSGEWIAKNIPQGSSIGTFINNSGLSYAYPYFNYFNYRLINDWDFELSKIKKKLPSYYIIARRYSQDGHASAVENIPLQYENYIDKDTKGSGFRWLVRLDEEKELKSYYEKIKEFRSPLPERSRFFQNDLIRWWTKEIKIYKRK